MYLCSRTTLISLLTFTPPRGRIYPPLKVLEIIICTVSLALVYLLKISFSTYLLFSERLQLHLPLQPSFKVYYSLAPRAAILFSSFYDQLTLRTRALTPRLTKAPYADSY